jgi:mannose/cellobiose epimerase-like protein (N-acyl-D-glucosamine 2-epimerase family)
MKSRPMNASTLPAYPDFAAPAFLLEHLRSIFAFYHPRAIDPSGGFFHFFKDDGAVYDARTRHLVSSCRFVFVYAVAARRLNDPALLDGVRHGLRFLRDAHWDAEHEGYDWQLTWENGRKQTRDATRHCYGHAFVLLACAHAAMAGVAEARPLIDATFALMERRFWQPDVGLYADETTADWITRPYRGQNANMHATEALLAAFEATGNAAYLDRAEQVATNIVQRQAALTGGTVWEHYRADWSVDWEFNRHDRTDIFRPWGFQPGHQTEWAKLLLALNRHRPRDWLRPRAVALFDAAMPAAWDDEHGGLYYSLGRDGTPHDTDKYFWVQAESLAAAAMLAQLPGDTERFRMAYTRLWRYSWDHFVDHRHGAWYRILDRDNRKYSDEKSPAGKTDYHTIGACHDVLTALERAAA